jgi:creatinine amidohydrolase
MGHADEFETSIMLVIDPDHVQMENAVRETLNHTSPEVSWDYGAVNRFFWPEKFKRMTKSGVIGDPTLATVEKGEFILRSSIDQFADVLLHIFGLSTD